MLWMLRIGAPIPLVELFEQLHPGVVNDHLPPVLAIQLSDLIVHA